MNKNSCLVININHFIISKMFVIYFIYGSKTSLLPTPPFYFSKFNSNRFNHYLSITK
jgi:hypothetical protein